MGETTDALIVDDSDEQPVDHLLDELGQDYVEIIDLCRALVEVRSVSSTSEAPNGSSNVP